MSKKQSSVEWFASVTAQLGYVSMEILEQAKAMHKEEIEEAYDAVIIDENGGLLDGKEYYKETFGGNNE
jgi:hypothetical protein